MGHWGRPENQSGQDFFTDVLACDLSLPCKNHENEKGVGA